MDNEVPQANAVWGYRGTVKRIDTADLHKRRCADPQGADDQEVVRRIPESEESILGITSVGPRLLCSDKGECD